MPVQVHLTYDLAAKEVKEDIFHDRRCPICDEEMVIPSMVAPKEEGKGSPEAEAGRENADTQVASEEDGAQGRAGATEEMQSVQRDEGALEDRIGADMQPQAAAGERYCVIGGHWPCAL